ncbi:MAG: VanZ family protein [Flavobacteriaceae bacterium]
MQQRIKRLSVPNYIWTVFALSVGAMIVFLSTVPLQLPPVANIGLSVDKLAHSFAYFVLATNCGLALEFDWEIKKSNNLLMGTLFLFGLCLELIQGYVLDYRTFEAYDLVANTIGILAFILLAKTIKKIVVKSRIFLN